MALDWKKSADDIAAIIDRANAALRQQVGMPAQSSSSSGWGNMTQEQAANQNPQQSSNYVPTYTGASNVIGNTNSFNSKNSLGQNYQGVADSVRANNPGQNQVNTWASNSGSIYDTTKMTPQQTFALSLAKDGNPNAARILQGMGLDINGNPTKSVQSYSFGGGNYNIGGNGGGGASGGGSGSLTSSTTASPTVNTGTMTATEGYTKNPTVDAMPLQQQLDYYRQHPEEAQQEILRSMQVYNGATTDAQRNGAHTWADMLRQAAGISDSDKNYGNNNGIDPATQRKYLDTLLAGRNTANTGAGTGSDGTGGTGTGTGAGNSNSNDLTSFKQSQLNLINDAYANRRDSQLQKIREARDIQLQGLNKVNVQAEDSATAQRGQIAAADIQAGNRLRESMAQMGLLNSGDNLTAQGNLNTQRQSAMGQTNQELARVKQDVSERQKLINDAAASNDLALLQELQAQQAQDMLALGYQVNDREYRDAVFGYNASQDAIKNSQWDKQFGSQEAQRVWDNTFKDKQWDYQKASDLWERTFKEKTFDQSVKQFAASLGADYDKMSQSQQQFVSEMAFKNKVQNWNMDTTNPDNQYKLQEIEKARVELEQIGKTKPITTQDAINVLNKSMFLTEETTKDAKGDLQKTGKIIVDKKGMVQTIAGLGVPDNQMDALFTYYGISQDEVKAIEEQLRKK